MDMEEEFEFFDVSPHDQGLEYQVLGKVAREKYSQYIKVKEILYEEPKSLNARKNEKKFLYECLICKKILKGCNRNFNSIFRHLTIHGIDLDKTQNSSSTSKCTHSTQKSQKYGNDHQKTFNSLLLKLIVSNRLPLIFVEQQEFIDLIQYLSPEIDIMSCNQLSESIKEQTQKIINKHMRNVGDIDDIEEDHPSYVDNQDLVNAVYCNKENDNFSQACNYLETYFYDNSLTKKARELKKKLVTSKNILKEQKYNDSLESGNSNDNFPIFEINDNTCRVDQNETKLPIELVMCDRTIKDEPNDSVNLIIKTFDCHDMKTKTELKSPTRNTPEPKDVPKILSKSSSVFCDICGKDFKSSPSLMSHKRSHDTKKKFKCSKCPKEFGFKSKFIRHMNSHLDIKPLLCSICGKRFLREEIYRSHIKSVHEKNKVYICDLCPFKFAVRQGLAKHMKTHLPRSHKFKCDIGSCDKEYSWKSDLDRHKYERHKVLRHVCHLCNESFRINDELRDHVNKVHSEDHLQSSIHVD